MQKIRHKTACENGMQMQMHLQNKSHAETKMFQLLVIQQNQQKTNINQGWYINIAHCHGPIPFHSTNNQTHSKCHLRQLRLSHFLSLHISIHLHSHCRYRYCSPLCILCIGRNRTCRQWNSDCRHQHTEYNIG